MRPFRFAIQSQKSTGGATWRDHARRVEDLGYSTLFVPDHFDDQWAPLVALTSAAEATRTLRVGSLVFDNDYRHPLVLARECATLDLVSEGRLEVGLGAGWLRSDYEQSGIAFDGAAERVARLAEAVQVLQALWGAMGPVSFSGDHYRLDGALGLPKPHTPGGPPLIIGGGSRRVLSLAAEHAAVVGLNAALRGGAVDADAIASVVGSRFDERVAWVRRAAGERFDELELQVLTFATELGRPRAVAGQDYAAMFDYPVAEVLESPAALIGTEDEIVETLLERRERFAISYVVLHDRDVDAFAPVVARLAGT
ncbi:MAG: TIGR03621 family F420-dependent LLM class oxidoreductase [Acidimicrobiales bacterium]